MLRSNVTTDYPKRGGGAPIEGDWGGAGGHLQRVIGRGEGGTYRG